MKAVLSGPDGKTIKASIMDENGAVDGDDLAEFLAAYSEGC